jgi:hypothetical protein
MKTAVERSLNSFEISSYKNTCTTKTNIPSKIDSLDSSPLILYD